MNDLSAESAMDRLKRSQANQEQMEQTVLEYEKTIQILESNLSNTRTLLAHTQSDLLEKEAKCTRTDTINQQLHSRVQKLMDRESNNKVYLRDLEARLGGQISGKEESGAIIIELHKEIARVRESEANAEDYISTLEERLAEADQDMETMQREFERVERVVNRQRSLGKLDDLLHELDHTAHDGNKFDSVGQSRNITKSRRNLPGVSNKMSFADLKEAEEIALPEGADEDLLESTKSEDGAVGSIHDSDLQTLVRATTDSRATAHTTLIAERSKDTTSLFELRLEHRNTRKQLQLLSAKYQEAVHTLARLQKAEDKLHGSTDPEPDLSDVAPQPVSPVEDVESIDSEAEIPLPLSRSLSSEISLVDENSSVDAADTTQSSREMLSEDSPLPDVDKLRRMLAEHEHGMGLVTQRYAQLQAEHQQTLETVDVLKAEVRKSKAIRTPSPGQLAPVIRRATSQNTILTDRANRSVASLRTLLSEEFEAKSSKMEMAEVHLSAASHELQTRLERIQTLETEMKTLKKEMDAKMAIISGLTRERNSLKGSSPVDLSMVSQIRDQLIQNENEIRTLHESHASRENELLSEIQTLRGSVTNRSEYVEAVGGGATQETSALSNGATERQVQDMVAMSPVQPLGEYSRDSMDEPQDSTTSFAPVNAQQDVNSQGNSERAVTLDDMQVTQKEHENVVSGLKREVEEHRGTVVRLGQGNDSLRLLISHHKRGIDEKDQQLKSHREQLAQLERDASEHKAAAELHKGRLESLHETHRNNVEEMKLVHGGQLAETDDQHTETKQTHDRATQILAKQIEDSRRDVQSLLDRCGSALGHDTSFDMLHSHIQGLVEEKGHSAELHTQLTQANFKLQKQLEASGELHSTTREPHLNDSDLEARVRFLTEKVAKHEETLREKEKMIKKGDELIESITIEKTNSARIIEELEQQIETSFDHHHNRLSVIQQQGNQALVDAQARTATLEKELEAYRGGESTSRPDTMKSSQRPQSPSADQPNRDSSMSTNLRKSASMASLPSPPPAIPLPPLPALATLSAAALNGLPNSTVSGSPPSSRHASKELPTVSSHQNQLMEDQEARIRTTEKHLNAEKQLTATLEEALVDLETQSNKLRGEMDGWKKKAWSAEEELQSLRRDKKHARASIQAVELERDKRREAEAARAQLEERMNQLSRKKKKNALNCF